METLEKHDMAISSRTEGKVGNVRCAPTQPKIMGIFVWMLLKLSKLY